MLTCHRSHAVALIFLANELIQKSLIAGETAPNFNELFRPILHPSLNALFEQLGEGEAYLKEKVDVIRVVGVWEERKIYDDEYMKDLKESIETNLQFPLNKAEENLKQSKRGKDTHKQMMVNSKEVEESEVKIHGVWEELAESMKDIQENRTQMTKLEGQIEKEFASGEAQAIVNLECLID